MNIKSCEIKSYEYALELLSLIYPTEASSHYIDGYTYAIKILEQYKDKGILVKELNEAIMILGAHKYED